MVNSPPVDAPTLPARPAPFVRRVVLRPLAAFGWGLAWLSSLALLVVAAMRLLAHDASPVWVWLNTFSTYLYLPAYVALAAALLRRRWPLAGVALLPVLAHLAWVGPDFAPWATATPDLDSARRLRVMSCNVLSDHTSPDAQVAEMLAVDADLLLIQEFDDRLMESIRKSGLADRYQYAQVAMSRGWNGLALFSKYPLRDKELLTLSDAPLGRVTVEVAGRPLKVYHVHPFPPVTKGRFNAWNDYWSQIDEWLREESGPVLVIGDFNATQHSRWHRQLTSGRMRSAHRDRGRGAATTWPNGRRRLPPIRIDHALVSPEVACLTLEEGAGLGSDHRPLILELAILPPGENAE